MADATNSMLLDEERRLASHQEVKAALADDINARPKCASARVELQAAAEFAGVAYNLKHPGSG